MTLADELLRIKCKDTSKQGVEGAILHVIHHVVDVTPTQLRQLLERYGASGEHVRSALVRLIDQGVLRCNSDMTLTYLGQN